MSYGECARCRALLLTEDSRCRICGAPTPVTTVSAPAATDASTSVAGATRSAEREGVVVPTGAERRTIRRAWRRHPHAGVSGTVAPDEIDLRDGVLETVTRPRPARTSPARHQAVRPAAHAAGGAALNAVAPVPAAIAVRGLGKTYGEADLAVDAVRGVTFEVRDGEVVLIMGPSGSGKTTLLLMLGAMLRPSAGTVVIGGTSLSITPERLLPKVRATHLGFIFQDFNLLPALSAGENIELACNIAGTTGRVARRRARDLLERVDLGHRRDHRPAELSGGEKQRVAVARALANDPPLLLADEPTANLDAAHGREIGRLLRDLADRDGRTSLIVTHDDRLTEIADRVLWLEDGRLRAEEHR